MEDVVTYQQCSVCEELFANYSELQQHNRLHESTPASDQLQPSTSTESESYDAQRVSLPSSHTGKQVDNAENNGRLLIKHENTCDQMTFQCSVCADNYQTLFELNVHKKHNHSTSQLGPESMHISNPLLMFENKDYLYQDNSNIDRVTLLGGKSQNTEGHQCNICQEQFRLYEELFQHCQEQHDELFTVSSGVVLIQREKSRENLMTYPCKFCPEIFNTIPEWNQHVQLRHCVLSVNLESMSEERKLYRSKESVACQNPLSKFTVKMHLQNKNALNNIGNSCSAIKLYECYICDATFDNFRLMHIHKSTHFEANKTFSKPHVAPDKSFVCEICDKPFSTKCKMQRHLFSHTQDKPFKCIVCSIQYNDDSSLRKHMTVHANEKNDVCYICEEKFQSKIDMKKHLMTHTQCAYCGELLSSIKSILNHMLNHTKNADYCQIEVKRVINTNLDGQSESTNNFEYPVETSMTSASTNLDEHKECKQHPIKCSVCYKSFDNIKSLHGHMSMHSQSLLCNVSETYSSM